MKNIILLTHGEFSKGIAQSCRFILGDVKNLTALSITLEETVDQIERRVMEEVLKRPGPAVLITDIPGGSTTQAGIRVMSARRDVYLVTGLNLGLLLALILLELGEDHQNNLEKIRTVVAQAKETLTLVNDLADNRPEVADDREPDGEL